jgi:hypothetical protein
MVFNATFNNISVISWRSVLFVEETVVPGFNPRSGKNKDYNICIWFFYAQHIGLSSKSYGWLSQTQYNVDEQSDTFTHGLLFQCVSQ